MQRQAALGGLGEPDVRVARTAIPSAVRATQHKAQALPTPWDQQWSLRMQQVLAFETDLLEHDDIFDGSTVIEQRTTELLLQN